jgi:hypothetical protein
MSNLSLDAGAAWAGPDAVAELEDLRELARELSREVARIHGTLTRLENMATALTIDMEILKNG